MDLTGAYCYFCDDNNLRRVDATRDQKRANLVLMQEAVERELAKWPATEELQGMGII